MSCCPYCAGWTFYFNPYECFSKPSVQGKCCQFFPHPHRSLCALGLYSYWLCYTPGSRGASFSVVQDGNGFCLYIVHFRKADKRHLALLLLCSSIRWMYYHTPTIICSKIFHLQWKKKKCFHNLLCGAKLFCSLRVSMLWILLSLPYSMWERSRSML